MSIPWLQWIRDYYVGEITGIIGLIVSVLGFGYTIKQVRDAKTAAEQAQKAVQGIRKLLTEMDTIATLSSAMRLMEEIKTHQRMGAWAILPDRYSTLRQLTHTIRSSNAHLTDENRSDLLSAAGQFSLIEAKIERFLSAGANAPTPSVPRLNGIVSDQLDKFNELLIESRQKIGAQT